MIKPSFNVPMDDVRKIIAHVFGVEAKEVIRNQYSFTVLGGKMPEFLAEDDGEEEAE